MMLLRFLLCLFAFIGALAAAGALVMSIVLMLRFPPLLVAVLLACWILYRLLKMLRSPGQGKSMSDTAAPQ
jgi:fatty acid desaturase